MRQRALRQRPKKNSDVGAPAPHHHFFELRSLSCASRDYGERVSDTHGVARSLIQAVEGWQPKPAPNDNSDHAQFSDVGLRSQTPRSPKQRQDHDTRRHNHFEPPNRFRDPHKPSNKKNVVFRKPPPGQNIGLLLGIEPLRRDTVLLHLFKRWEREYEVPKAQKAENFWQRKVNLPDALQPCGTWASRNSGVDRC